MNIHTVNDLCDFIDKDLAWRKKELSILKGCVESQVPNNLDQIVLIRCGIALLYAHWEGFIKKASSSYLEFIKMQRLRNDQLKPNFLTLSMRHTVNFCSNSNLNSEFGKVTDFYINSMSNHAKFPYKDGLDTKSNLSSIVLKEFFWCLGLDYTQFETKEKFIDIRLVNKRNYIAHGQFLDIEYSDYIEIRDEVLNMLEIIRTDIENCAAIGAYRI